MSPNTDAEIRSPWYETFTPGMWVLAAAPVAPARAPKQAAALPAVEPSDDDWATEAIFEYYND